MTAHPTAEWTARQLIHAFPEQTAPRFLVRDRDKIYGERLRQAVEILGIEEAVTAARSPWQNPYAERLIGSLRRDCSDQVIVLDEVHLRRILGRYFEYDLADQATHATRRGRSFRQEQLHTAGIEVDLNRFLRKC